VVGRCFLSISDLDEQSDATIEWPSCWTLEQKNEFISKIEWLFVSDMKLCRDVAMKGIEINNLVSVENWIGLKLFNFL